MSVFKRTIERLWKAPPRIRIRVPDINPETDRWRVNWTTGERLWTHEEVNAILYACMAVYTLFALPLFILWDDLHAAISPDYGRRRDVERREIAAARERRYARAEEYRRATEQKHDGESRETADMPEDEADTPRQSVPPAQSPQSADPSIESARQAQAYDGNLRHAPGGSGMLGDIVSAIGHVLAGIVRVLTVIGHIAIGIGRVLSAIAEIFGSW